MTRFIPSHKSSIFVCVAIVSLSVIGYTAYAAATNAPKKIQGPDQITVMVNSLALKISQYQEFASTSLESISKTDRELIRGEIQDSIDRLKLRLDAFSGMTVGSTTKPRLSLTKTDAIFMSKMDLLLRSFRPTNDEARVIQQKRIKSLRESLATTTATSSDSERSPRLKRDVFFAEKASISDSDIHKIIVATTIQGLQEIRAKIEGHVPVEKKVVKKEIKQIEEPVSATTVASTSDMADATTTTTSVIEEVSVPDPVASVSSTSDDMGTAE